MVGIIIFRVIYACLPRQRANEGGGRSESLNRQVASEYAATSFDTQAPRSDRSQLSALGAWRLARYLVFGGPKRF